MSGAVCSSLAKRAEGCCKRPSVSISHRASVARCSKSCSTTASICSCRTASFLARISAVALRQYEMPPTSTMNAYSSTRRAKAMNCGSPARASAHKADAANTATYAMLASGRAPSTKAPAPIIPVNRAVIATCWLCPASANHTTGRQPQASASTPACRVERRMARQDTWVELRFQNRNQLSNDRLASVIMTAHQLKSPAVRLSLKLHKMSEALPMLATMAMGVSRRTALRCSWRMRPAAAPGSPYMVRMPLRSRRTSEMSEFSIVAIFSIS